MRKKLLNRVISVGVTVFLLLGICGFALAANVQLEVAGIEAAMFDAMQKMVPEFEERHPGVKVNLTVIPIAVMFEKQLTAGKGRTGEYDIWMTDSLFIPHFAEEGFWVSLDKYIERDKDKLDVDDFVPSYYELYAWKGHQYAIPLYAANSLLFYRKDLFNDPKYRKEFKEKYGRELTVPATYREYVQVAEFFTRDTDGDGSVDLYGTVGARGRDWPFVCDWMNYLYMLQGDVIIGQKGGAKKVGPGEPDYLRPGFANEKGYLALQRLLDLSPYMPPGVETFGFFEVTSRFAQGDIAMVTQWADHIVHLENPEISRVAGKVGVAPIFTMDDNPPASLTGGWGLAISRDSKHPDLAWEFILWVTGRDNMRWHTQMGGMPPCFSVAKDPELTREFPYLVPYIEGLKTSRPFPMFVETFQMVDILARELSLAYHKQKTVKEAIDYAAAEIEKLMQRAGYYQ